MSEGVNIVQLVEDAERFLVKTISETGIRIDIDSGTIKYSDKDANQAILLRRISVAFSDLASAIDNHELRKSEYWKDVSESVYSAYSIIESSKKT